MELETEPDNELDYYDLEKKLGGKGASDKTAQLIVSETKNKT